MKYNDCISQILKDSRKEFISDNEVLMYIDEFGFITLLDLKDRNNVDFKVDKDTEWEEKYEIQ